MEAPAVIIQVSRSASDVGTESEIGSDVAETSSSSFKRKLEALQDPDLQLSPSKSKGEALPGRAPFSPTDGDAACGAGASVEPMDCMEFSPFCEAMPTPSPPPRVSPVVGRPPSAGRTLPTSCLPALVVPTRAELGVSGLPTTQGHSSCLGRRPSLELQPGGAQQGAGSKPLTPLSPLVRPTPVSPLVPKAASEVWGAAVQGPFTTK